MNILETLTELGFEYKFKTISENEIKHTWNFSNGNKIIDVTTNENFDKLITVETTEYKNLKYKYGLYTEPTIFLIKNFIT